VAYYDLLARNELFIANGDVLVVNGWNSVVGQSLTIRTRRRTPQGDLVTSENTLALTADRQANTLAISLNDGTLVGIAVHPTVAVQRGQTFVRVGLARGAGNPEQMTLAQDYVTIAAPLGWPGGRIASPTEGPGAIRSITGTDPAAGQEISVTVPTNALWLILGLRAVLVTDATAITRVPRFVISDGTNVIYESEPNTFTGASVTMPQVTGNGLGFGGLANYVRHHPLPTRLLLRGGFQIQTITAFLQAGDDWGPPQILVEEWIDV
jgi:hypothetical protein